MMKQPLVTIVLTTFNRAYLIEETLDSIIKQTYTNWKCIIIDDQSEDQTKKVVTQYIAKDSRFQFFEKGSDYVKGLSASRNMGMDLIEATDLIQFFDDDDIMHPQKLEIQVNKFIKNPELDLVVFPTVNFNHGETFTIKTINASSVTSKLIPNIGEDFILVKRIFTAQVPLIKYDYIKDARFDESLFYAEEWALFNRLFFTKRTVAAYVDVPLYFHRKHDLSITANLYGKSKIREISQNKAFYTVYETVKTSRLFNGSVFCRFITYAINSSDKSLLHQIKNDLKKGLLSHRIKDFLILKSIPLVYLNKKMATKLIHRISRW